MKVSETYLKHLIYNMKPKENKFKLKSLLSYCISNKYNKMKTKENLK